MRYVPDVGGNPQETARRRVMDSELRVDPTQQGVYSSYI